MLTIQNMDAPEAVIAVDEEIALAKDRVRRVLLDRLAELEESAEAAGSDLDALTAAPCP